ncbi:CPBP family intramembrane glutamic endopeptidase [Paraliobacillus sp. X-1268]|uniref:CPBP family intramembrane glutamic endopeptidase n=1 Tax=Paraliobacillus sp. X-1268 TaxID=2213193 RepID=UPI000E3E753B|nr:type II CAAX endopeptidase family protein [Paraliobacillus sp. X-1268]
MKNKQAAIIATMTSKQVRQQVYISQSLLLIISLICAWFIYGSFTFFSELFEGSVTEIMLYGLLPGFIVVIIDMVMYKTLPKRYWDDGGINEKIFRGSNIYQIIMLTMFVAIAEEVLFRGVLQPSIGYIATSLLFAFIHIRYLFKPVLFNSVVMLSFYIGFMFEITNNLGVTIIMHFVIDCSLALYLRFFRRG